jgi:hypothetical protein
VRPPLRDGLDGSVIKLMSGYKAAVPHSLKSITKPESDRRFT